MNIIEIIEAKRDGHALSAEQIDWFVDQYTRDLLPDYQAAALAMAIYLRGMNRAETTALTLAMARSGDRLDLHDTVKLAVDKHSSGGVGDKTTLVVGPLVAACGLPVGKMSGRGLGASGGTIDKMESISGWSPDLNLGQFKNQLKTVGFVLAGQTARLAPADGKLYALRDVTGTVGSIPLIASSIMSKKLAAGADVIVLDVKVGSGAFTRTLELARELAEVMVQIGEDAGRRTVAILSNMNQPLGMAVGNSLEVKEAIATLRGQAPADFWAHCLEIGGAMLRLAGHGASASETRTRLTEARDSGGALDIFRRMVEAQGGDGSHIDDPERLPTARFIREVVAPRAGWIAAINAGAIGWACLRLGGGRLSKGDVIDPAVGVVMPIKVGDHVAKGDLLLTIHASDEAKLQQAREEVLAAISCSDEPVAPLPHSYGVVGSLP